MFSQIPLTLPYKNKYKHVKTNRILIYLVSFLSLIACQVPDTRYWLDEAERYLPLQPDSASAALEHIHFPGKLTGKEKADYWFLHAQSRRNSNRSYVNDSLLKQSIAFYVSANDSLRSQNAYRLEAQRQEWMGNHQTADSLYRKAIQYAPSGGIKPWALYDKLIMLHGNHINPKDYPLARAYARQLLAISTTPDWLAHAYYQLAVNYNFEGLHPDSAIYYTHKCLENVRILPERERPFYLSNCANMIGLDAQEALSLLREAIRINPSLECSATCTQGYIYLSISRPDSALLCYQTAIKLYEKQFARTNKGYPTLHNSLTTLYACASYASRSGDIRVKDFIYNDSIQMASNRLRLINEENQELQQNLRGEQLHLELRQQRLRSIFAIFLCVSALIGTIAFIYIHRRKQRWIASEEKIEALELIVEQAQANTSEEPAPDGAFFRRILLKQLGMIRLIASTPTNANQDLLRQFNKIGQDTDTSGSLLVWEELYPIIDASYSGFYTKLANGFGHQLNEKEIQLCCLLRAGFTTKEINVVTGQSLSTIYHRKIDIRRKLELDETGALSGFLMHIG